MCVSLCTGFIYYIHNRSKYYNVRERERDVFISIICLDTSGTQVGEWMGLDDGCYDTSICSDVLDMGLANKIPHRYQQRTGGSILQLIRTQLFHSLMSCFVRPISSKSLMIIFVCHLLPFGLLDKDVKISRLAMAGASGGVKFDPFIKGIEQSRPL